MNTVPAAHFHTVVNALHESALSVGTRAADESDPDARAARLTVQAQRMDAFYAVMANAEIDARGYYVCGAYRVPATISAFVLDALALPSTFDALAERIARNEERIRGPLSSPFPADELAECVSAMVNAGTVRVAVGSAGATLYFLPV